MMRIEAENLSVARGGLPVLDGVTFTLDAGAALVLTGPNGSGKTTLLRTIAGLQPALSGRLQVDANAVAYAGHADGIKATLSVAENLEFWAGVFGQSGIDAALEAFAITPLRRRPAGNLSAGQRRRLGLARLLVTGRPIWVLDEPTISLDTDGVALFGRVVAAHLAGGGSALMASHIDLGVDAQTLDMTAFKARSGATAFDGVHA